MQPKRELRQIDSGATARAKLLSGARKIYEAVSSTYGPDGNNVLLELPFGDPTLTRDGVTVAKRVSGVNVGLPDRLENMAASVLRQASEKTNKTAGDGTTATVVLGYNLLTVANKHLVAGDKPRIIQKQLDQDKTTIIDWLKDQAIPAGKHLHQVATVSAGDENIGRLIADTIEEIGLTGGISIRERGYPVMDVEKVNGYYFDKGFFALNGQMSLEQPNVFVTQRQFISTQDILPLLNYVVNQDNKKFVLIGDVAGDALNVFVANAAAGKFDGAIVPPPAYGDEALQFMEDIACYVGSKLFTKADNPASIDAEYFGTAEQIQISQDRAIIFNGAGDADDISTRAADLKKQIEVETNEHRKDQLEQRYSKLVGKIAIVNVGGSTQAEMEQLKYRVEDAIEATKSAMADGVLPGGATMLVHIAKHLDISPIFAEALNLTFKKLMDNAGEDPGYRLKQVQVAPLGHGFNLREMTEEPIDLKKSGVFDAARSVMQTIENATSAAGSLLTTNAAVTIVESDHDNEPETNN